MRRYANRIALVAIAAIGCAAAALVLVAAPSDLRAETPLSSDRCPGLVSALSRPMPAAFRPAAVADGTVRLTFIGHSTFLIETAGGLKIATDYNDYIRPSVTPDLVTMNKAHNTHYSNAPDPGIGQILRGWNPAGGPVQHDVTALDTRIRNITTNIRDFGGGTEYDANSIFVFETAALCIAHLGHLHHRLTKEHLAALGKVDVVLVPVDGSYTLNTDGMVEVLAEINAPLMIPMHYFGPSTLERFLDKVRARYEVVRSETPTVVLSRETLPATPQVLVLPGR